ncbi:Oxoglutarate and iron-dependent oxygenase degradation C-term-domain-containing protein [Mycena olivaceomarginata]|nr:Oxoglutarate and iron-dependent oxygenase degradation C-term-domain-containing protein [Mycena olivaceomarginata]
MPCQYRLNVVTEVSKGLKRGRWRPYPGRRPPSIPTARRKWRYCVLAPVRPVQAAAVSLRTAVSCDEIVRGLQDELFPAPAFHAWLAIVSWLLPTRHCVEARRFRPGLDYTLATSEEKEARLDVVLGLTPEVRYEGQEESSRRGGRASR